MDMSYITQYDVLFLCLFQISVCQALLGGTVRIQGLYEDHTLQVNI